MSITYVLSTLRRRWLTVLLVLLLGALGGAAFAGATPDRYEATASLVVTPVISNPLTGSREDVNIRTEQEILGSREVARRAAASLGGADGGASLRGDVEVAAPLGSQILQVTVRGDDPQQAADGADAIAGAYLDLRREAAATVTERYLEGVDQQIEDLRAEPSTVAVDGLIERLQQQRSSVTPSDQDPGRIIGAAVPPTSPSGPGLLITAAGGAMAGLLLGVAAAVLRERLDPSVRSADRIELAAGPLPVVASRYSDEQFWARLADETIRRSRVDPDREPVRVLMHAAAPMPSRIVANSFRSAAQRILSASGAGLPRNGEEATVEHASAKSAGCVMIVPSGRYRTSLAQAARRSDVAVVVTTPQTPLKDVTELVATLRECGLEVVVGLAEAPVPPAVHAEPAEDRPVRQRHRAVLVEQREIVPVPVSG